jgi:uncharacterized membrane protein YcgQ (UPF0703/DUF1980 family)
MKRSIFVNGIALSRSIILFGLLFMLVSMTQTGELIYYIHPRFQNLTQWTRYILFAFLLIELPQIVTISRSKKGHACGCGHSSWSCLAFVFTLCLVFLLPNGSLDASMVTNKGLNSRLYPENVLSYQKTPRPLAAELQKPT